MIKQNAKEEIKKKQQEQINMMKDLSDAELTTFLSGSTTNAAILEGRDAIYSTNNSTLYDYIDHLKEAGHINDDTAMAVESLTQSILENMSTEEAWKYASDETGEGVKELTNSIADLTLKVENASGKMETLNVASILSSDDYSLKDQVKAYEVALESITKLGNEAATAAFKATYSHYEYFATLENGVLDFIDSVGITIDEMNKLYGS